MSTPLSLTKAGVYYYIWRVASISQFFGGSIMSEVGLEEPMFNATVVEAELINERHLRLCLKPDAPCAPFHAGQYVVVGLPAAQKDGAPESLVKRTYSIASPPSQREQLEFCIEVLPEGELSSKLPSLKPGDRAHLGSKIAGTFTLEGVPQGANLVLVATGTGIAPFMSFLRSDSTWNENRLITLIHGARNERELDFSRELRELESSRANFRYIPVLSRSAPGWTGRQGRVQRLFEEGPVVLNPERDHVFLCGSPEMVKDLEMRLSAMNYRSHTRRAPGNLHLEKFWQ
jgi:ferredoxin/flavodoxin---NADP+ reductase